jgi:protoporphyrinogen oxidase
MTRQGPHRSGRWAILGGGILGMTLALRLRQAGQEVSLLEAAGELGGLAAAWQLGDITWDRHYHVTLLSDTHLRKLLTELDLEQEIEWRVTRTGFFTDGALHSLSNTLEFLKFPPLGWWSKLRLGATIFRASRIRNWQRLEQIPATEWLERWSGRQTLEKLWVPLLRAKLGENYRKVSAAFIWAIIARMYAARRTGLKKEMFGYVPGGYGRILERLGQCLKRNGVEIGLNHAARLVEATGKEVTVEFTQGSTQSFDRVVLTMPAPVAARLCPQLSEDEQKRLAGIEYQGIICASLLLRRPLAGYYVTNITDEGLPFTGVIEMSNLVDRRHFNGNTLVYVPKYVTADDPAWNWTEARIRECFLAGLERIYRHFQPDDVLAFKVSRVKHVLALTTLNYSQRLPPLITSVPGVAIVNSAHIVNGTLNVNETIQLAERALRALLGNPDSLPFSAQ